MKISGNGSFVPVIILVDHPLKYDPMTYQRAWNLEYQKPSPWLMPHQIWARPISLIRNASRWLGAKVICAYKKAKNLSWTPVHGIQSKLQDNCRVASIILKVAVKLREANHASLWLVDWRRRFANERIWSLKMLHDWLHVIKGNGTYSWYYNPRLVSIKMTVVVYELDVQLTDQVRGSEHNRVVGNMLTSNESFGWRKTSSAQAQKSDVFQ
jgi:hypothetical protein